MFYTLLYACFSYCFLIFTFFYFKYPYIQHSKNFRILSLTNAIVTSMLGVYRFYQYNTIGLYKYSCKSSTNLDDFVSIFFIVYLYLDLSIGFFEYKKALTFLTVFHHICFLSIMIFLYNINYTACSSVIFILELPTIFLCCKHLFPRYKLLNDFLFGVLFLFIRILLQLKIVAELFIDYFILYNTEKIYFIPIMSCMLLLHLYWFNLYTSKKDYISIG